MAIQGVNAKKKAAGLVASRQSIGVIGTSHAQPSPFRATGRGFFNRLPDFAANAKNSNASLTNVATSPSNNDFYKIWLFVNAIQTGWTLAGEHAQGQMGRVFYPRNIAQDELSIEGIVANQHEFDRIVQFVEHHHHSQFAPQGHYAQSLDGNGNYPGIRFVLFKPEAGKTFDSFKPIYYSMVITDIEAGAERFKNYPTYVLTCKVTYDHLQNNEEVSQALAQATQIRNIFGTASNPTLSTGSTPSSTAKKTS